MFKSFIYTVPSSPCRLALVQEMQPLNVPDLSTKTVGTCEDRKAVLESIQAMIPNHQARLESLQVMSLAVGFSSTASVIIIIINFYGAYILRNLSSEAQQNIIIKCNCEQGRTKVVI